MVSIAIAGVTSQLAKEVLEALVAADKHQILGLARKIPGELVQRWQECPKLRFYPTTYESKQELINLLEDVDVVLCFFSPVNDPEGKAQMRLIDAAVEAGVKRYIPSEWFTGTGLTTAISGVPYMAGKLIVRQHLEDLNRDKMVIEYSLISPGMFMDYLAYPHVTHSKHTAMIEAFINMQDMRGFYMKGHEGDKFTVTAIHDIVNVVLRVIDYEGAWPVNGGVVGETVSFSQLVELGQKLRGKEFAIDVLDPEDVKAGKLKVTKLDRVVHPSAPRGHDGYTEAVFASFLSAIATGGMVVDGEWNRLLPDYRFMTVEEMLRKHF